MTTTQPVAAPSDTSTARTATYGAQMSGVMLAAFGLFVWSLSAAGVDMSKQSGPLAELPPGVSGYVGWANRLLFAASYLWVVLASWCVLKAGQP